MQCIDLPVADLPALLHRAGPRPDRAPEGATGVAASSAPSVPRRSAQPLMEGAPRQPILVDIAIDGFVADAELAHAPEPAGDLAIGGSAAAGGPFVSHAISPTAP